MMLTSATSGPWAGIRCMPSFPVGLKNETLVKDIENLYRGFLFELIPSAPHHRRNLTSPGTGSSSTSPSSGSGRGRRCAGRRNAGDMILVTGIRGTRCRTSAAASVLASEDHPLVESLQQPFSPRPGRKSGGAHGCATAMIDTSDGFLGDLGHIARRAKVGALLVQESSRSAMISGAANILKQAPMRFSFATATTTSSIITCRPKDVERVRSAIA